MNPGTDTSSRGQVDGTLMKAVNLLSSLDLATVSPDIVQQHDYRFGEVINNSPLDVLETIRPNLHPVNDYAAYVAVLHASLAAAKPSSVQTPILLSAYARFALDTRPQLAKILPSRWCGAGRHAARLAVEGENTQRCLSLINPLRVASEKCAPSNDHLVPLHVDFLAVCIHSKMYDFAARFIRRRRLQINVEATALEASDVVLIFYYSGVVFIAMKEFRVALDNFRIALAVPVNTSGRVNELILSVYKKYVLMNILVHGCSPTQGLKFCTYNSNRLRNAATEYVELGSAYNKRKLNELQDIEELNRLQFEKDGNLGLVKQVIKSLPKLIIKRLTDSFVTMRIEDVAVRAGLKNRKEAEKLLLEMVGDGSICGHIDGKDQVVRFITKGESVDGQDGEVHQTPKALLAMNENMQQCIFALRRIQLFRDSLLVDSTFIKKDHQMSRQRSNNSREPIGFVHGEDTEMEATDFAEESII